MVGRFGIHVAAKLRPKSRARIFLCSLAGRRSMIGREHRRCMHPRPHGGHNSIDQTRIGLRHVLLALAACVRELLNSIDWAHPPLASRPRRSQPPSHPPTHQQPTMAEGAGVRGKKEVTRFIEEEGPEKEAKPEKLGGGGEGTVSKS